MFTAKETNSGNKSRTPSRCREWERQRRLKFNDAISKLGDIVKSINKENVNGTEDKASNVQFPKIEIIQKAILCLTNFTEEKSKLKAEVLALEIKLEEFQKQKCTKDVCVQVAIGAVKGKQNNKLLKLLRLKNLKNDKKPKENSKVENSSNTKEDPKVRKPLTQIPKLLPLPSKKDNAIVMVQAAPYIFPQRPILLPTATPTIVFVDTNMQPLNKHPIINRNLNDLTKTTMVNVLPISAYSHPLSATKGKKSHSKQKPVSKKVAKKTKEETKVSTVPTSSSESALNKSNESPVQASDKVTSDETQSDKPKEQTKIQAVSCEKTAPVSSASETNTDRHNKVTNTLSNTVTSTNTNNTENTQSKNNSSDVNVVDALPKIKVSTSEAKKADRDTKLIVDKSKENKLESVIDAPICENVVDTGNARLELAEEFLAASPTAAFLMSFPLVSGNRADSPSEEPSHNSMKDNSSRSDLQPQTFYEKSSSNEKAKEISKSSSVVPDAALKTSSSTISTTSKTVTKGAEMKPPLSAVAATTANENPFLNLPLPTIITTSCTLTDPSFGLDFDCNMSKMVTSSQSATYVTSNNLFYKGDPFTSVKNTVYSTSSLSSGHDYNNLGLYPCAVDSYSAKNKSDYSNIEENLMKINTSRLTYDIDLGWSHKSLDFVNCTTTSISHSKDNVLTSTAPTYSTAYNPFNADFHASLANASKKDVLASKSSTFSEAITSFYSQTSNLWADDISSMFSNTTAPKNTVSKQPHFSDIGANSNLKAVMTKQYDSKQILSVENNIKSQTTAVINQSIPEKYTKKSPTKMHINWMTSETRSSHNNCENMAAEVKENYKSTYGNINVPSKKINQNENYFPINMHHFPPQPNLDDLQTWPSAKPAGTAEISIEPPPIHLPTLVGDLALGPHEKKRNDLINRGLYQTDQNCANFLSVTQLMNRSSDHNFRHPTYIDKSKNNISQGTTDSSRKTMNTRHDTNLQHCYGFSEAKTNNFDTIHQFSNLKAKNNKEKHPKLHKNNYSAEALIRGGTCNQKTFDVNNTKYMMPPQKFTDFNITQDSSVAQVSHYPPLLDYSENSFVGQQYSGTTLYNSTSNTIPNSFYSNFMQSGASNLMPSSYTGGPFTGEFIDYNQGPECNYTNHKYDDSKIRNNFQNDKNTRREATKHKLDCNKKETSKKYPSKRSKINTESEDWGDTTQLHWQNKVSNKRHSNMGTEEVQFPNFVSNQMPTQYQPDFLNSHLMSSNMQNTGHNNERASTTFPVASRSNFNLSALFPEITMKVQ